jgi:tRNA1(Val) A37 N6-methylase TrmN6
MANPPFHSTRTVRAPRDEARARAHLRDEELLDRWMRFAAGLVTARGTITMILPAALLAEALPLFSGRTGAVTIFPLFPRAGEAASRVILQGVKGSRAAPRLLPGLVLHKADGGPTDGAESVLRRGAGLAGLAAPSIAES